MADRSPPDTQLFRNYPSPQEMLGITDFPHPDIHNACIPSEQLIWRAAKASGAAPSFFRPEGNYVDGGILANNPSLSLLTEVTEYNIAKKALDHEDEVFKPKVLVSLGTGIPPVRKVRCNPFIPFNPALNSLSFLRQRSSTSSGQTTRRTRSS